MSKFQIGSGVMAGKKGVILGVANGHSIAWGAAKQCADQGADLAFTYQGEQFERRVRPLAQEAGSNLLIECDVSNEVAIDRAFDQIKDEMGEIDFVLHAIAYSNKEELKGRYVDTSLENFLHSMQISCYSFTSIARRCADIMPNGGSLLTLSYLGAQRVMPNYNVMGVAKAALESSVRYIAQDLGEQNIRVNGISAGPMRTLAGSAIGNARSTFKYNVATAPLRRPVGLEELGNSCMYFLSDLSSAVTGEIHYVDCGFNAVGMPPYEALKDLA